MMEVYIMRGLPGSGKSSWIQSRRTQFLTAKHKICSADSYHTDTHGNYNFDPQRAGEAHTKCLLDFLQSLQSLPLLCKDKGYGLDYLYCDYTNTTVAEISPYYRAAVTDTTPLYWL